MYPDKNKPSAKSTNSPTAPVQTRPPQPIPRLHLPSQVSPGNARSASSKPPKRHRGRVIALCLLVLVIIAAVFAVYSLHYIVSQPVNKLDGSTTLVTIQKG